MAYKPKYLRHINVYVRNAERSQKWYEDVLGLHGCDFRLGRAALISADIEQFHGIALMQVADDASSPLENHVGLNHTAWMMESLDDLKELGQRLKDENVEIDRVSDYDISIGVYLEDPDNEGIQIPYEISRRQWPREENPFLDGGIERGDSGVPRISF